MDRLDDGTAGVGKVIKCFHDRGGCEAVKPSRRLVEEDEARVRDDLDADRGALTLTTGDALDKRASNSRVLTFRQPQLRDDLINSFLLRFHRAIQLQLGSELEALAYAQCLQQDIVLLNVSREGREAANFVPVLPVHKNLSRLVQVLRYEPS